MKNSFGIQTRVCTEKDYHFVYNVTEATLFPYAKEYEPIETIKKEFDKDFRKRHKEIVIMSQHNIRIGFYHITPDSFVKDTLYVVRIFIHSVHQRIGIGTFLMKYFETLGYKKIRLQVFDNSPSVKFYKKLKYKIISKKKHKYLMEKKL